MKKTSDLSIDTELTCKILTGFIQTEITRAGFSKAVVGLSGGIDSSLSCYLAAEALGAENVLAVRMPYESSSPGSLDHARLVIDELGVQAETVPITAMVLMTCAPSPGWAISARGDSSPISAIA